MRILFLVLILLGICGCETLTPSERKAWDNYFKQMEQTHQIDTKFLLENPKQ